MRVLSISLAPEALSHRISCWLCLYARREERPPLVLLPSSILSPISSWSFSFSPFRVHDETRRIEKTRHWDNEQIAGKTYLALQGSTGRKVRARPCNQSIMISGVRELSHATAIHVARIADHFYLIIELTVYSRYERRSWDPRFACHSHAADRHRW